MEKRIIELNRVEPYGKCLVCCERPATIDFRISRPTHGDSVTSFHICDECLAQMKKDIEICK